MKSDLKVINIAVILVFILGCLSVSIQAYAQDEGPGAVPTRSRSTSSEYFSIQTMTTEDGKNLDEMIIGGPPKPPPGYELERVAVALPQPDQAMAINSLTVPAYNWVFGCSAVSGAMIAAYYDRNGYSDIYTGPTNSGVMPLDSSVWSTWIDGVGTTYPNNPLVASHNGVDGRTIRGSIDDYWISYNSNAADPYITNGWTMHTWGDAIGDYMKTSQSTYGNRDGSTAFYNWETSPTQLTCTNMETLGIDDVDGTYGRKLFYEAKGYTVTDCYNQKTDNNGGGFTFAMFMAEIDAGQPVFLNLAGHSIVGVGYDDSTNTIYVHDTWDYSKHTMTWGGSYVGMDLLSVSIVNLASLPSDDNYEENDTLASAYDLSTMETDWLSTIDGYGIQADSDWYRIYVTPGDEEVTVDAQFTHSEGDINIGLYDSAGILLSSSESTTDDEYIDIVVPVGGTYYFIEVYYGNQGNQYDLWWDDNATSTSPGTFDKTAPTNGATGVSIDPALSWGSSSGTESYEYCYDTTNDNACSSWTDNGTDTSVALSGLSPNTIHYWHVRAVNSIGTTYSNDSAAAFWSFTTLNNPPNTPSDPSPTDGAVDQDLNVDLNWTGGDPDGDSITYDVYFEANDSSPDILVSNDQSGISYDPGSLATATEYCWQIVAADEHGASNSGPVWCFTTLNNPPNTPSNPSPADGAVDQDLDVDLNWTGGDPDGDTVTYDVYFGADDLTPDVLVSDDQPGTSYNPGALAHATDYCWQIAATDDNGVTSSGPVWCFTTLNNPPNTPFNPSPVDGAVDQDLDVDLGWTGDDPDGDTVTYDVYFEADDSTPDILLCNDVSSPTCDPGSLMANTHYYWYVVAADEHGASNSGPAWDYTTLPPEEYIVLLPFVNRDK